MGGHLYLLCLRFAIFRRGKGGNLFFSRTPCIRSRVMLYFALPFWRNSSDTVRRGPSNGHLIRPDKMGGNACGKPGKAPQAFFCRCLSFKRETDRRPIRGTLCESGPATASARERWSRGDRPTERASPAEGPDVKGQDKRKQKQKKETKRCNSKEYASASRHTTIVCWIRLSVESSTRPGARVRRWWGRSRSPRASNVSR